MNYDETMTDLECLTAFTAYLPRVSVVTELTQEGDLFTGKVIHLVCGDYALSSDVIPFETPLMLAAAKIDTDQVQP